MRYFQRAVAPFFDTANRSCRPPLFRKAERILTNSPMMGGLLDRIRPVKNMRSIL
ncbi:MAG: hypothetical protein ACI89E_000991, partial [Planctomycetota bacterium]